MHIDMNDDRSERIRYNFPEYYIYAGRRSFSKEKTYGVQASHWHNDIELLVVLSGSMQYNINGKILTLNEGQGIFTNAKQVHYGYYDGMNDCEFAYVLIHPLLLGSSKYVEQHFVLPVLENSAFDCCVLDRKESWQQRVIQAILEIEQLAKNEQAILQIQGLIFAVWKDIYEYSRTIPQGALHSYRSLSALRDMIGFVQKNYKEKITLAQVAEAGNVCKSNCCAIFKRYLNQTVVSYLTNYRLDKSMELLRQTDMSITEICYEVGFSGASYYAELFHQYFKCSPSQYRKRCMK